MCVFMYLKYTYVNMYEQRSTTQRNPRRVEFTRPCLYDAGFRSPAEEADAQTQHAWQGPRSPTELVSGVYLKDHWT